MMAQVVCVALIQIFYQLPTYARETIATATRDGNQVTMTSRVDSLVITAIRINRGQCVAYIRNGIGFSPDARRMWDLPHLPIRLGFGDTLTMSALDRSQAFRVIQRWEVHAYERVP